MKEINIRYRMIRATNVVNAPDKYMTLKEDGEQEQAEQSSKSGYNENKLAKVGLASESYSKNYNPNLKVYKSKEQEGD